MPLPHLVALALAAAPAPRAAAAWTLSPSDDAERLLAFALRGEPSIEDVQRAAAARAAPSQADADGWRRRSRLAPLVPRLTAEYRRDSRSYRVAGVTSSAEVDYIRDMPGETVLLRLTWDLDGLVFGRAELDAVDAAERASSRRRAAVDRATHLYFERLRLRLELLTAPPSSGLERARRELELEALTAELRALTGLGPEGAP
jgi:hypothetical protein